MNIAFDLCGIGVNVDIPDDFLQNMARKNAFVAEALDMLHTYERKDAEFSAYFCASWLCIYYPAYAGGWDRWGRLY